MGVRRKITDLSYSLGLKVKEDGLIGCCYGVRRVEFEGGERYPRLIRDSTAPEVLSRIVAPLARQ